MIGDSCWIRAIPSRLALIQRLPPAQVRLSVQVLGDLVRVLYGKAGRSGSEARQAVLA